MNGARIFAVMVFIGALLSALGVVSAVAIFAACGYKAGDVISTDTILLVVGGICGVGGCILGANLALREDG